MDTTKLIKKRLPQLIIITKYKQYRQNSTLYMQNQWQSYSNIIIVNYSKLDNCIKHN